MTFALADLRLWLVRGRSLVRRGLASLRTRGWRHSWERVKLQFARQPSPLHTPLIAVDRSPFAPFAVPHADDPQASIVIPVYGQWLHTLACLRAIAAYPPERAVELILVDDASPDETLHHAARIDGLRVVARPANGGFISACNDGAAAARGRFLIFLNNDTVPQPGWLDALLDTFDLHPDTGLAGAQLLYPDGRLQEAGVVCADVSAGLRSIRSPTSALRPCTRGRLRLLLVHRSPRALLQPCRVFDARYAPPTTVPTWHSPFARPAAGALPSAAAVHDEGTSRNRTPTSKGRPGPPRRCSRARASALAGHWHRAPCRHPRCCTVVAGRYWWSMRQHRGPTAIPRRCGCST